jgi:hypothetical protein
MTNQYETDIEDLPKKEPIGQEPIKQEPIRQKIIRQEPIRQESSLQNQENDEQIKNNTIIDKLKQMFTQQNLNILFIIGIIYIFLTSDIYMSNISKYLNIVKMTENKFNNIGILLTAVLFGIIFILAQNFVNS